MIYNIHKIWFPQSRHALSCCWNILKNAWRINYTYITWSLGANWWEKAISNPGPKVIYYLCLQMAVPCAVSAIFISGQSKLFCRSVIPYYSIPSDSIHVLTKTSTSSRQRANYLTHFKSPRWFRWVGLCKRGYCFPWNCFYHNISSNVEAGIEILLSLAIVL